MCVLIVKPSGAKLPDFYTLLLASKKNPDGFGFVTPSKFYKSLDFEDFYNHLSKVCKKEPCIIHMRWATHGSVCVRNCHPFVADAADGEKVYFAHNGILSIQPIGDMTDSETAFKNAFMPALDKYGISTPEFRHTIDAYIGGSKLAFLKGKNIVTYGHFIEMGDCLFSNLYFLPYRNYAY